MPFEMQPVPGVSGTILSDVSFWRGLTFIVNGQRAKPRGIFVRRVTLQGTEGPGEGKIKGGLPGAQRLVVADKAYPTGPLLFATLIVGAGVNIAIAVALRAAWWQ